MDKDAFKITLIKTFYFLFFLMGIGLGKVLSGKEGLETFKLLNLFGISMDLVGLIVLTEYFLENSAFRRFVSEDLAGAIAAAVFLIPSGMVMFTQLVQFGFVDSNGYASIEAVSTVSTRLMPIGAMVFVTLMVTVWRPTHFPLTYLSRSRILGTALLILGMALQFVAALQDLGI